MQSRIFECHSLPTTKFSFDSMYFHKEDFQDPEPLSTDRLSIINDLEHKEMLKEIDDDDELSVSFDSNNLSLGELSDAESDDETSPSVAAVQPKRKKSIL